MNLISKESPNNMNQHLAVRILRLDFKNHFQTITEDQKISKAPIVRIEVMGLPKNVNLRLPKNGNSLYKPQSHSISQSLKIPKLTHNQVNITKNRMNLSFPQLTRFWKRKQTIHTLQISENIRNITKSLK